MTTALLPSMTTALLPSMTSALLPSMTSALLPSLSLLLLLLPSALCHEYYDGPCPQFPALQQLDWTR